MFNVGSLGPVRIANQIFGFAVATHPSLCLDRCTAKVGNLAHVGWAAVRALGPQGGKVPGRWRSKLCRAAVRKGPPQLRPSRPMKVQTERPVCLSKRPCKVECGSWMSPRKSSARVVERRGRCSAPLFSVFPLAPQVHLERFRGPRPEPVAFPSGLSRTKTPPPPLPATAGARPMNWADDARRTGKGSAWGLA